MLAPLSVAAISPAWKARLLFVSSQARPPSSQESFQNDCMNLTESTAPLLLSTTFLPVLSVSAPPKAQSIVYVKVGASPATSETSDTAFWYRWAQLYWKLKMSAPAPDWMAAVMRAWRSLALMVSSTHSAPSALEASGIWRFSSTSDSGMKSTQRTQCSLVPWAKAGARRAARMPSMPPGTPAAMPVVLTKVRRSTCRPFDTRSSCLSVDIDGISFDLVNLLVCEAVPFQVRASWFRAAGLAPAVGITPRQGGHRVVE